MAEPSLFFLDTKLEKIERLLKATKLKAIFEERQKGNSPNEKWFLCKICRESGVPIIFAFGKTPEDALVASLKRVSNNPLDYARGISASIGEPPVVETKKSEQLDFVVVSQKDAEKILPKLDGAISAEDAAVKQSVKPSVRLDGPHGTHEVGMLEGLAKVFLGKNKPNWMSMLPGIGFDDFDDRDDDIVAP